MLISFSLVGLPRLLEWFSLRGLASLRFCSIPSPFAVPPASAAAKLWLSMHCGVFATTNYRGPDTELEEARRGKERLAYLSFSVSSELSSTSPSGTRSTSILVNLIFKHSVSELLRKDRDQMGLACKE